ncbi:MAG TPA: hypothetical protein VF581_12875 [Flavobacterium sp.]|jgi:hypothetical protein
MKKTDLLVGFAIGIITALAGSYIFIVAFFDADFSSAVRMIEEKGHTGKIITLGAILNIIVFFTLLHYKKELMARGVVLATIALAILTIFF